MKKITLVYILLFTISFYYGCVSQKEVMFLSERLAIVERYNAELDREKKASEKFREQINATLNEKEETLRNQAAELRVQIDQVRDEIKALNGRFEEVGHSSKQNVNAQDIKEDKVKETEERLNNLEKHLNIVPSENKIEKESQKQPQKQEQTKEANKEFTEQELYTSAKQFFDDGQMDKARDEFKQFISKFSKSKNAGSAQYWLGEIYYNKKEYEKAILEYQKVIEKYSNNVKFVSALFKQATAFYNLGDKANSKLIFNEVINKFPKSNEAKLAKQKLKVFEKK